MTEETLTPAEAIARMTALLRTEIAALETGDFATVEGLFAEKAQLADRIAALDGAGDHETPEPLRESLTTLRELVARDAELLERVTAVTTEIAGEIGRIRDRHGLGGLYGKSGQKRSATQTTPSPRGQFDRSL